MRTRPTEDDPYPDYERRLDALDATDRQERWRRWGFWSLGVVVLFGSLGVLQAVSRPAPTPPVPSPVASTQAPTTPEPAGGAATERSAHDAAGL